MKFQRQHLQRQGFLSCQFNCFLLFFICKLQENQSSQSLHELVVCETDFTVQVQQLAKDLYERELRPAENQPRGMALKLSAISKQIEDACANQVQNKPGTVFVRFKSTVQLIFFRSFQRQERFLQLSVIVPSDCVVFQISSVSSK